MFSTGKKRYRLQTLGFPEGLYYADYCYVAKGWIRHRSGTKVSRDKQAVAMIKKGLGTVAVPIRFKYDHRKGDSKTLIGIMLLIPVSLSLNSIRVRAVQYLYARS